MVVLELGGRVYSQEATAIASWLLHLACSILSYFYINRVLTWFTAKNDQDGTQSTARRRLCCMIGVLITFCHPQRAEAVAWLSAQVKSLYTDFVPIDFTLVVTRNPL